jgi:endothelin-converting enzyme/putative endopeptidase
MRFAKSVLLAFVCLCAGFALAQNPTNASELPKLDQFDPKLTDASVDPCTDFYKYACNKWMAANPIPPDQAIWGHGSPLQLWNETVLRQTLEKAAAGTTERSAVDQKIGDYYGACMDEKAIEAAGVNTIKPELDRINAVKTKNQLPEALARLHQTIPGAWQLGDNQTNAPGFGFIGSQDLDDATKVVAWIDQGGMSLPGRDFYVDNTAKSEEIRKKYLEHLRKMFVLAGENEKQAAADAAVVMDMETSMARSAMENVKRRDPKNLNNKMTMQQVQAITPSFNWKRYFTLVDAPTPERYIVTSPDFFRNFEQLIKQHSLDHWKTYLRWQLLHGAAPYLNDAIVRENFDFFGRTLQGRKELLPRWRRCVRAADRDLGEALGQAYVNVAFPPESKERTVKLVHAVERALDRDIKELDWMTPATKKEAATKLHAIEDKIGYPNSWRNYSSVKIGRKSWFENVQQSTNFEFERWVHKIGKPVDRTEWGMTPPTINAYYDPQLNTINFPAGILQPPFFDKDRDESVNYGAIGMVIGHEITHGFDDQGRKFDDKGDLRDWWTPTDAAEYEKRGKCIAEEYSQQIPEAGVKQNGLLTQGEDTADNGGLRLALMALEDVSQGKDLDAKEADGWTARQRFFLSYANSWCNNIRPEIARTIVLTNPHSLAKYRVNNVVTNLPQFRKAFGCREAQPMARVNACRVW